MYAMQGLQGFKPRLRRRVMHKLGALIDLPLLCLVGLACFGALLAIMLGATVLVYLACKGLAKSLPKEGVSSLL